MLLPCCVVHRTTESRNFRVPVIRRVTAAAAIPCAMSALILLAAGLCAASHSCVHLASIVIAAAPLPRPRQRVVRRSRRAGVSWCGRSAASTIMSRRRCARPSGSIIPTTKSCSASPRRSDPVVPLVERLIADILARARLLIGDDRVSENPKLNNVCKGWRAATHHWIVIADSNVLMPPDYIQRLFATWRRRHRPRRARRRSAAGRTASGPSSNALSSTPIRRAGNISPTASASASRKARRCCGGARISSSAGGIAGAGAELAEDAAATKIVRDAQGLRVRLVDGPFGAAARRRSAVEVWKRQLRWARLRRASFPACYLPEILSGGAAADCCACGAGMRSQADLAGRRSAGACDALVWRRRRCSRTRRDGTCRRCSPFAWLLRDLLLPVLWIKGWRSEFVWRGNAMRAGGLSPFSSAR